jgi:hypothetical protein
MDNKENNPNSQPTYSNNDDNSVVFIPLEDIRVIENVLNSWETLKHIQLGN